MTDKNSESDTLSPNGMDSQPVGLVIALVGYMVCVLIWMRIGTFPSWIPRWLALGWPLAVMIFWPLALLPVYAGIAVYERVTGPGEVDR